MTTSSSETTQTRPVVARLAIVFPLLLSLQACMEIPPPPEIVQPEPEAEKAEHGHSHMSIDFERLDPNTGVIDLESDAIAQNEEIPGYSDCITQTAADTGGPGKLACCEKLGGFSISKTLESADLSGTLDQGEDFICALPATLWTVNGQAVQETTYLYLVELLTAQIEGADLPSPDKQEQLDSIPRAAQDRLISMELMAQAARTEGLDQTPETLEILSQMSEQVLPQVLIESYLDVVQQDLNLEEYYQTYMAEFRYDSVDLRMIMVTDEAEATTVQTALDAGGDFEELASIHNSDPQLKSSGGDFLGDEAPVELSALPPAVQTELGDLQTGSTTPAFELSPGQGWILLHVKSRESGVHPLEDVRDQLIAKAENDAISALMHDLPATAEIVQGDQPPPENAEPHAEGDTVSLWINGTPYSQEYFSERIGPAMQQQQAAFQQQNMAQLMQVPADQQQAFMQYMQQQWATQAAQIEAQLKEEIVMGILLTDKATSLGFHPQSPRVKRMNQIMMNEVLSSIYFSHYLKQMEEAGEDPRAAGPDLRAQLTDSLWTAATVLDSDGVAIPPPER